MGWKTPRAHDRRGSVKQSPRTSHYPRPRDFLLGVSGATALVKQSGIGTSTGPFGVVITAFLGVPPLRFIEEADDPFKMPIGLLGVEIRSFEAPPSPLLGVPLASLLGVPVVSLFTTLRVCEFFRVSVFGISDLIFPTACSSYCTRRVEMAGGTMGVSLGLLEEAFVSFSFLFFADLGLDFAGSRAGSTLERGAEDVCRAYAGGRMAVSLGRFASGTTLDGALEGTMPGLGGGMGVIFLGAGTPLVGGGGAPIFGSLRAGTRGGKMAEEDTREES